MTTPTETMGPMYALPDTPTPDSPSLTFNSALARFEYEAGADPAQATKVLMVEWEDDARTLASTGTWHVSWRDRHSVLPALDPATPPQHCHRIFFLLPPATPIPPSIQLRFEPTSPDPAFAKSPVQYNPQPLPAIFPPQLGASARAAGKKGVLHTLWAKQRLAVLTAEIAAEARTNVEGVGLEMALQEKEWIELHFGVAPKRAPAQPPAALTIPAPGASDLAAGAPPSPASPRSPGGGRLLEKLKGLRVGTSEAAWGRGVATPPATGGDANPLSPMTGDVAVSSFAAIKGSGGGSARAPSGRASGHARKITAQAPPADLLRQQENVSFSGLGIDGITGTMAADDEDEDEDEAEESAAEGEGDGLFALPMSPRSPEMSKSPFSFGGEDVQRWKVAGAR